MEQVSLPMRIALLAVLAFAGLWFVALRPKPPEAAPPPPAPAAASGVTGAPAKAAAAADKADAASAAGAKVDPSTPTAKAPAAATPAAKAPAAATPAAEAAPATAATPATGATPAAAAKDPARPQQSAQLKRILADLDDKRTVVLLFWDGKTADDREVRRAVAGADRHDGRVKVHVANISKLGEFEPITRGVPVVKSPTVIVAGRDRKARSIAGLTVRSEIDELVDRAIAGK